MNILQVWYSTTIPTTAAPTFQIFKMCQAFALLGHKIQLLSFVDRSSLRVPTEQVFEHYGVSETFPILRMPLRRIYSILYQFGFGNAFIGYISGLYAIFRKVDLVYTRQSVVAYYALKMGLKVVYETHPFPYGEQKNWDGKEFEARLIKLSAHPNFLALVTLSPLVEKAFIELGIPKEKTIIQPSGIDYSRYENPIGKEDARQKLKISSYRKIVLYAGRLSELKGTLLIFEIAKHLRDMQFILLGPWGDRDIEENFRNNHADKNIAYKGVVTSDQLPIWIACADLLILPTIASDESSRWTSPLKLFEYMASGRPIIASNLPNIYSILENRRHAILVDGDSIAGYVQGIKFFINNPTEARNASVLARELSKSYSWERRVDKILSQFHASVFR